ncbi:hypothetical protein BDM02DRAFT_473114 [Thelephora ganbajun]|uniref:Uncharacterized protein n=1 Tax=Thelephora ganbajun TaxID=370292 RepID=A0ACB6Z7K6_THEGA|nr:hypothetical protein BDM02DRAFT_473114 [Thelephora ganbajun]
MPRNSMEFRDLSVQAVRSTELFGGRNSNTFRTFEEFGWEPFVEALDFLRGETERDGGRRVVVFGACLYTYRVSTFQDPDHTRSYTVDGYEERYVYTHPLFLSHTILHLLPSSLALSSLHHYRRAREIHRGHEFWSACSALGKPENRCERLTT